MWFITDCSVYYIIIIIIIITFCIVYLSSIHLRAAVNCADAVDSWSKHVYKDATTSASCRCRCFRYGAWCLLVCVVVWIGLCVCVHVSVWIGLCLFFYMIDWLMLWHLWLGVTKAICCVKICSKPFKGQPANPGSQVNLVNGCWNGCVCCACYKW